MKRLGIKMEQNELAQAIIVERNEERSFDPIIRASAMASISVPINEKLYDEWAESGQRKTVRDAKPSLFQKIIDECESDSIDYSLCTVDGIRAIALPPMRYEDFSKNVSRAQVSGFKDIYPHRRDNIDQIDQCYIADYSLNMPVGKCAAQLAHAYHYAVRMGFTIDYATIPVYFVAHDVFQKYSSTSDCVVVDSGLTVFNRPTTTICYVQ